MRTNSRNILKIAYVFGIMLCVLLFMGEQYITLHAQNQGEDAFELEAGAASLFGVDEILYSQDEIEVSDAEKLYGANLEVLSEEAKLWRELEEKVGNVGLAVASDYIYVRKEADINTEAIAKAYGDSVVLIRDIKENEATEEGQEEDIWYEVESEGITGYIRSDLLVTGEALASMILAGEVDKDYIENKEQWETVLTKEEEAEILAQRQEEARVEAARLEAQRQEALQSSSATQEATAAAVDGDTSLLRQQIVEYSMQFLGNCYISGGTSLSGGTDCSGFTCFIYKDFGYSIDRTPGGQYSNAGRSIPYSEIKPGDIICYGNGKCTHVALYIGNGQIIHSANSRKGVVIYEADYDNIMAVKSILD